MLKTIESFFTKKNILISKTWIQKIISLKNIQQNTNSVETEIYKEFLVSDISESYDNEANGIKLEEYVNINTISKELTGYHLFQISDIVNIAQPTYKYDGSSNNLDVLEDVETAYLQKDENDKAKKVSEKRVLKFKMTQGQTISNNITNSNDNQVVNKNYLYVYGFEYTPIKDIENLATSNNKFQKVLVGPKIEVRRGIFYLTSQNFQIL